jgi:phosphohistidine phosphatase SixA
MINYYLLRHSKAGFHEDDLKKPLSEMGLIRAEQMNEKLADIKFDLVLYSKAIRTQQTGDIICRDEDVPRKLVPSLYAPLDLGDAAIIKRSVAEVRSSVPRAYLESKYADTWEKFANHVAMEVQNLIEAENAKKILIISHAIIINLLGSRLAESQKEKLLDLEIKACMGFKVNSAGEFEDLLI